MTGIDETLAEKVDRRVLRLFGHVERMDEGRWPRNIKPGIVECPQRKGRPRFCDYVSIIEGYY